MHICQGHQKQYLSIAHSACTQVAKVSSTCTQETKVKSEGLDVCGCKKNNKLSLNPWNACFRHHEEVCAAPGFNFMVGHCKILYFACPWCDSKGSRYPFTFLLTLKAVGMNSPVPSQRQQGLTHLMFEFPWTSKIRIWLQIKRSDNEN